MNGSRRKHPLEKKGTTADEPCIYCRSIGTGLMTIGSMDGLGLVCHACGQGFKLERTDEGKWVMRK